MSEKDKLLELLSDPANRDRMLSALSSSNKNSNIATPERLTELAEIYNKDYEFKVGDIVRWKPFMKNRKSPPENTPAIVMEILEHPFSDESEVGSTYFREPLDIVLGTIHSDGEFLLYHFCSKRFEPYLRT